MHIFVAITVKAFEDCFDDTVAFRIKNIDVLGCLVRLFVVCNIYRSGTNEHRCEKTSLEVRIDISIPSVTV